MRLFIAIEIPEPWRDAARRCSAALVAAAPGVLRLVDPALMHLTVRFLGEVAPEGVPELQASLARDVPPVDVELWLAGAGTFGPPARTAVAWLGIDGDLAGLSALAERIERAVVAAGLPPEPRPIRAHLTLARVARTASPAERRAIAAAVRELAPPAVDGFRASAVTLFHSQLGRPQPRYEVLSRHG